MSQQSIEIKYCRDRSYSTTHIAARQYHLSEKAPNVYVNYARVDQIEDMRRIIGLAEKSGDGVGVGEFANDSTRNGFFFNFSEIFAVSIPTRHYPNKEVPSKNKATVTSSAQEDHESVVVAYIVIHPCLQYSRGYDTCLALLRVLRGPELGQDDSAYRSLVHLGVQLADEINCGYSHAVVDVAMCNVNLLRELKNEGFNVAAIVPDNVEVVGVGSCENLILAKCFREVNRKVPFLPQHYTLSNGLVAIIRNMRKEEDTQLFKMVTDGVDLGHGYGVHEYPSIDYFRMHYLSTNPTVVFEDASNKMIIGYWQLFHSMYPRGGSNRDRMYESLIFINKDYRGIHIGSEFGHLDAVLAHELGFTCRLNNTFISNAGGMGSTRNMMKLLKDFPSSASAKIGVIPNAGYLEGLGWDDIELSYSSLGEVPPFSEILKENAKKVNAQNLSKL